MAQRTDAEELRIAWRALAGETGSGSGWRTIPIGAKLSVQIRAGRHFPENTEAVLVGFEASLLSGFTQLPEGRGFSVALVSLTTKIGEPSWVCLSRSVSGSQELFTTMAADVLNAMASSESISEVALLQIFVSRIAAWQYFMEQGTPRLLGDEAEVGLIAELLVLHDLMSAGMPPNQCVDVWGGPAGAVHDFELAQCAFEIKCTLSPSGMPVTISSLAQLESPPDRPLCLIAIRLALDAMGSSLPSIIEAVCHKILPDHQAMQRLKSLLLRAGYLDAHAEYYQRRFVRQSLRVYPVKADFPKLTRTNVPPEILDAKYDLDLDRISQSYTEFLTSLQQLGIV